MKNRIIKFRAWDKDTKVMFEVSRHSFPLHDVIDEGWPLMQFTGLTDKNGKEIYEGDIVQNYDFNGHMSRYKVAYFENGFYLFRDKRAKFDIWWNLVEVIGNIYENPELLTQNN